MKDNMAQSSDHMNKQNPFMGRKAAMAKVHYKGNPTKGGLFKTPSHMRGMQGTKD